MTSTTASTPAKPSMAKALKAVQERHNRRQTTQVLTGVVVSTGGQVETPSRGKRAVAMVGRVCKGIATAPKALRAYRLATEYDASIVGLADAGDHAKALAGTAAQHAEAEKRRKRVGIIVREVSIILPPLLFGGWFWVTLALGLALAAEVALLKIKAMHGKAVARTAQMLGISLLLEILEAVGGVHPTPVSRHGFEAAWSPWLLTPPLAVILPAFLWLVGWAIVATKDDGSIADNLGVAMAPMEVVIDNTPPVIKAILASEAKLAKDAVLTPVSPGVVELAGGKVWRLTVDTGGPTAQPIVDAIDDIASRLNLDESRCFIERQKGLGRRATITGITQDPFGPPSRSPLMDMPSVDLLRDGLPWGTDWVCERVTLQVVFRNFLLGGSPDAGKSTAGHPFHAGFALSPRSKLWIADGGRVDTARLRDAGLTHRWVASDPEEVRDVLVELNAEADMRQELLDEFGASHTGMGEKVSREFFDYYEIDLDLFWWDEFASHMRCSDPKLAKEISKLSESVLQRIRKLGIVAALATQSPSSIVMSTDGRDVISDRIALACRTREMSDKITGGMASEGVNAKRLNPTENRAWLSTAEGNRIVRADYLTGHDLAILYQRAATLRSGVTGPSRGSEVPAILSAAHQLIRSAEAESMRSAELVGRLRDAGHDLPDGIRGQQLLAVEMAKHDVRPVQLWSDGGKSHYLLSEVEKALRKVVNVA